MDNIESNEGTPVKMKITGVLKKFNAKPDGTEWTNEEIEAGLADDYLAETITFEDEVWR